MIPRLIHSLCPQPSSLTMEEPFLPLSTPIIPTTTNSSSVDTPVIDPSVASAPSTCSIAIRLALLAFFALVSLWANHEASKGFEVSIAMAATDTHVGRWFDLMFVSNGRATRMVLDASEAVEHVLYPDPAVYPRKPVKRVSLRLASHNLSSTVTVGRDEDHPDGFVLSVSPSVVNDVSNAREAMALGIHRAMARVWLWEGPQGTGTVPQALSEAMVEHLAAAAGFSPSPPTEQAKLGLDDNGSCWSSPNRDEIARFLQFCEGRSHGFVARLNRALRAGWNPDKLDAELGSVAPQRLCQAYRAEGGDHAAGGALRQAM